jgi:hypothetical protein
MGTHNDLLVQLFISEIAMFIVVIVMCYIHEWGFDSNEFGFIRMIGSLHIIIAICLGIVYYLEDDKDKFD